MSRRKLRYEVYGLARGVKGRGDLLATVGDVALAVMIASAYAATPAALLGVDVYTLDTETGSRL